MKTRVGLVALLSIAMLGAYVRAQFGDKPAALDTIKVKDDLFVIHNDFVPGNTTVLVTSGLLAVVAAGLFVVHWIWLRRLGAPA